LVGFSTGITGQTLWALVRDVIDSLERRIRLPVLFFSRLNLFLIIASVGLGLSACDTVARGSDMVSGLISKPQFMRAKPAIAASQPATQVPQAARPVASLENIVGMSDRDVQSVFGSPTYVRHEQPAAVWQYRRSQCIVDLFMYRGGPTAGYQVEHVELRPLDAGGALSVDQRQRCAAELARTG